MTNLKKCFYDKTTLVTGHTGFKGSWLTAWLLELGSKVVGISDGVPTTPAHFITAELEQHIRHYTVDIRQAKEVEEVVFETRPDFVFHLAAQTLVRRSYVDPLVTFHTNALGTAHVLNALRGLNKPCVAVLITSDKCYENLEWVWGYRETDRLGGKDPYSASKAAAELVIRTYAEMFTHGNSGVRVGVSRAGNVIGGGDWAEDRLVPDCVRAWNSGNSVLMRSPYSTRPWQHVLESLSGYLALASSLSEASVLHGEAFNFGPRSEQDKTVQELINALGAYWPGAAWQHDLLPKNMQQEAVRLRLNCDKALQLLRWTPTLDFSETVHLTADWYRRYYADPGKSMFSTTLHQLTDYMSAAKVQGIQWAQ